jgi:hypothetical protein
MGVEMSYAVLRIYENAPNLVDSLLAHEDDVRGLLMSVNGFRQWGLFRTETGGMSFTSCDTAEGCAETVKLAATWIAQTLPDQKIAPPTVYEGEIIHSFSAGKPEAKPYVRVAIFSAPGPPGAGERGDEIREIVSAVPGYRSYTVVRTATGAFNGLVTDDKASADEIRDRLRAWLQTNYPGFSRPDPQIIEGQAVKRIIAQTVPA